jgi:hypothetical protein
MQYSGVSGGYIELERIAMIKGILLMRKDRNSKSVELDSFRNIAFERVSKEAVIRSMVEEDMSPWMRQN